MNKPFRPLLLAVLALLAVVNASAQTAIVGAWTYGNTASPTSSGTGTFVFLSNGVYFHAESENTADALNGQDGIERGTYAWNGTDLTLNSLAVNTNGQWGLSDDPGVGNSFAFDVTGDTALGGFLSRVTGASPIVGAWTYGNTASPTSSGTGAFVFLSNGVYFHIESENTADALNGQDGMERGTYLWNGTDLTLDSLAVNTNGQWGLSDDPGVGNSFAFDVTGNTALGGFLTRVTAIPEPSTYAALAGLGALGLAVWRRRQVRLAAAKP